VGKIFACQFNTHYVRSILFSRFVESGPNGTTRSSRIQ